MRNHELIQCELTRPLFSRAQFFPCSRERLRFDQKNSKLMTQLVLLFSKKQHLTLHYHFRPVTGDISCAVDKNASVITSVRSGGGFNQQQTSVRSDSIGGYVLFKERFPVFSPVPHGWKNPRRFGTTSQGYRVLGFDFCPVCRRLIEFWRFRCHG